MKFSREDVEKRRPTEIEVATKFLAQFLVCFCLTNQATYLHCNRYIQAESWLVLVSTLCSKKYDFKDF